MFDIAFTELVVIGVVALVVLGPERLPKVARTAGHLFGRLQRYVATVKADLNREMEFSELSKVRQEVQEAARAFEQSAQQHTQSVEAEARALSASLEEPVTEITSTASSPTQSELLTAQEQGLSHDATSGLTPVPAPVRPSARPAPPAVPTLERGTLDLGIEPVRGTRT
ncbi:MAG: Sec-independent protein translocase protein TatB [Betaproteobacteria bacterium]